jgi:superfamily II DNA or RNA helicase
VGFSELQLLKHFESDSDDIMADFYRPVLSRAVRYDRAVGYFSSSTFRSCALELSEFVRKNGKARLIIGCLTNQADLQAISKIETAKDDQTREAIRRQLIQYFDDLIGADPNSALTFATLITAGIVTIRFALRDRGIYHEKFGVFEDRDGARIAFIGSVNETSSAMDPSLNHESISVYDSRDTNIFREYGEPLEQRFEKLWRGETKKTRIYDMDRETIDLIRQVAERYSVSNEAEIRESDQQDLRPYQTEALVSWEHNSYRGILAMATGTGKTRTALAAVKRFRASPNSGIVVITVPYQNLALQWRKELENLGIPSYPVFQNYESWFEPVKAFILNARYSDGARPPCLVCVNRTFNEPRFRELLGLLSAQDQTIHFLVADEAHHFNSELICRELPDLFTFRLALSATPYDQFEGHDDARFLANYFGDIVYNFSLERAVQEGFLCPYNFYFFPCSLDQDESAEYDELTKRLVRAIGDKDIRQPDVFGKIQPILIARSRIVAGAKDKLRVLANHLQKTGRQSLTLFYCGDSSIESDYGTRRHVEVVTKLLDDLGWRTSRVTAEETLGDREAILRSFSNCEIDAIVSIRVLDEGIDLPSTERAYLLASQSSNRQGIQRRGRVLRKHPAKTHAEIFDFVVVGAQLSAAWVQSLGTKEIKRAIQFALAALNRDTQLALIREQCTRIGINFEEILDATKNAEERTN